MRMLKPFILGALMHGAFTCLMQDWYGLELYIQLCRAKWVHMHWAWWLLPVGGIGYLFGVAVANDILSSVAEGRRRLKNAFPNYQVSFKRRTP